VLAASCWFPVWITATLKMETCSSETSVDIELQDVALRVPPVRIHRPSSDLEAKLKSNLH
jgi:hypothetical protein